MAGKKPKKSIKLKDLLGIKLPGPEKKRPGPPKPPGMPRPPGPGSSTGPDFTKILKK